MCVNLSCLSPIPDTSSKLSFLLNTGHFPGGRGVGLLPHISEIGMCRSKGYGFWAGLVWKLVWKRNIQNRNQSSWIFGWILPILDFVTDAKLNYSTTKFWKRVWILEARSKNGCGKWHVLVWNWARIGEPGGTPQPRIPRSTSPEH